MQLCSIMGDQHLHNLYPSYSLRTNQMLFFSMKVTWIIYISEIYLFCGSQWSQWLFSPLVIYHLWWRELGRLPDWANECKYSVQLAGVTSSTPSSPYLFSSLSIHSKPINKCGMSFTMAVKRLIFIKKGRNGHLFGTWGTWLCFDSDDKHTWQLNYVPSTRFLFYLGDGNPLCERPSWLNTWKAAFMVAPVCYSFFIWHPSVCHITLWYFCSHSPHKEHS